MIDLFTQRYSLFEVLFMIILAALPMSRISELILGICMNKLGISLKHEKK